LDDDEATRIAELEADNRRLRRLLDRRDAPGELRHRLNNTLAMLRIIIRKSAAGKQDLGTYVSHLEDRLTALGRVQAAIDAWGVVDLHSLITEELLQYGALEDDRLALYGPAVRLQPRAGQVMALAIHELAVNAVEHGALGAGAGLIRVTWSTSSGVAGTPLLTVIWEESGAVEVAEPNSRGFGTEVLTETLRYELKAETEITFSPDALRCTIRLPLTERVGCVAAA